MALAFRVLNIPSAPGRQLRSAVIAAILIGLPLTVVAAEAKEDQFVILADEYAEKTRPLMKEFCLECHSTEQQEGELDLERFSTLANVRRSAPVWQKVVEMLSNGEMPPKDSPQPSQNQRKELLDWMQRYLHAEALANAGDPGPVVLRRLSNAQYNYTIRDLTGIDLEPAREFPADSAAGEGFTNTGSALVMSPALLAKYFDAGKKIARHAVLLPDGMRFSPSTTRSDWTNEALAQIRALYAEYTDSRGASQVNLQGIVFNTNDGGRLPVERYLAATLAERDALQTGSKTIAAVAQERNVNAKYLGLLWAALNDANPSLLLDAVRARWRSAKPDDAASLTAEISGWQKAVWRFSSVGHIGKVGGPKGWQEPIIPLSSQQEIRLKLATSPEQKEVRLYLVANDAGDGSANDFLTWQQPRLVAPGRPDLLLRDVREFMREMTARRERLFASTAKALNAVSEITNTVGSVDTAKIAEKHGADLDSLNVWLTYLGVGPSATIKLDHFTEKLTSASNYDFVQGWGSHQTPLLLANSSDNHVRIPGNMEPHGVCVHPSPTLNAAVGWQSPIRGQVHIDGKVTHAHPECGNGVAWSLELRRGATRRRLAAGIAHGGQPVSVGPIETIAIEPGDLVSLFVGPRDNQHACDLTDLEFIVTSINKGGANGAPAADRKWSLTHDVSGSVLAGNPHADSFGNEGVWHFYTEPVNTAEAGAVIPAGSLLARWQSARVVKEREQLANEIQNLLTGGPAAGSDVNHPDAVLHRQLSSLGGPLFMKAWSQIATEVSRASDLPANDGRHIGLDPAIFGKHPNGSAIDAASLSVQAPSVVEVGLPAELADGAELVVTGALDPQTGSEGSVQVQVLAAKPETNTLRPEIPILVADDSAARKRFEKALEDFRRLFPIALCYTKIVPVDEVVTLTLFHREDEPLRRLMLSDEEAQRLDRLWEELHFVSHDALALVDVFEQLMEYASQDGDPTLFEPLRNPINDRAAEFKKSLIDAEPRQIDALIDFAAQAYRRPLSEAEDAELRALYKSLRQQDLAHEEALRFTLARIFISPAFLYRLEEAPAGNSPGPISDWELATRLSYFLWSSQPDDELRGVAASGMLHDPEVLTKQAQRMLADSRMRRLATEFACQWLHIYDFDELDEKSESHFPGFRDLRSDMYEEAILFFTDLFQRDASVLTIFEADHTFVSQRLAKFYGIQGVAPEGWTRIDSVRQHGRGGILGFATTLAKQSGASRTSPILRGNWVSEVLLGERLPRPPKDVPQLPEDETATDGLTVRELTARHTSDSRCSTCHQKIDPFGFALESFDAIGRLRTKDLAGRAIDTKTMLPDGQEIEGLPGLRKYLVETRRDAVVGQFCRKLLGFALGRSIQLSDEPLLEDMQQDLKDHDYRFSAAVTKILLSRQFREIRGKDTELAEAPHE